MSYSSFTLDSVKTEFQLEIAVPTGLFSDVPPVAPSAHLKTELERNVPVALAIGTEKAKSEMIVGDVLLELREHFDRRISLFSGIDFNVDAEKELTGACDFLVNLSPMSFVLEAPIIVLVEARKDDLLEAIGQCVAEMIAAQQFNAERANSIPYIYGVSTTGADWRFLKLDGQKLHIDQSSTQFTGVTKTLASSRVW